MVKIKQTAKTENAESLAHCHCPKVMHEGNLRCEFAVKWIQAVENRTDLAISYETSAKVYSKVLAKEAEVDLKLIQRDVDRTFNEDQFFCSKEGKQSLTRLLTALCKHSSSVGYTQGLNSFAASVLWHSDEVLAFELVLRAMNDYHLKEVHMPRVPGLF